jgi:hypothetical protein
MKRHWDFFYSKELRTRGVAASNGGAQDLSPEMRRARGLAAGMLYTK